MRVLLVEPPKTPWEMMGDVVAPPLGLAQLAGCLENAEIPVEILDANALELGWNGLEKAISHTNPDLIGITAFTPYVPDVAQAVRVARQAAPQAVIVLGDDLKLVLYRRYLDHAVMMTAEIQIVQLLAEAA